MRYHSRITVGVLMPRKKPSSHNTSWSSADVKKLRALARKRLSARAAAIELGRTRGAVAQKALALKIAFRSINRRRRRKG
jgi:hypothetical protein